MLGIHSQEGYTEVLDGIKIKTIAFGRDTMMTEFILSRGATLPEHSHANEQTGYLVKGKMRLYVSDSVRELDPGDSWSIPGSVKHKADILEDSVAVEVFSPVREDYFRYLYKPDTIE